MCTHNSTKFLAEQLDTVFMQSHANWHVCASDNGSQDNTADMLKRYKSTWGPSGMSIYSGPQTGVALNFLSLVNNQHMQSDYHAYSGRGDI